MTAPEDSVKLADGRAVIPALISGSITGKQPTLSASGSRLFTPCCTFVLCFSVKTEKEIASLKHSSEVTAICAGASRAECAEPLATGTASGIVQLWDTKTFTRLSTIEVEGPVLAMRWPRSERLLIVVGDRGQPAKVVRLEVPLLDQPQRVEAQASLEVDRLAGFDAVDDVVAMSDGKEIVVWMEGWSRSWSHPHAWQKGRLITAVSIDPSRRYVAAGTAHGDIFLYWDIFDKRRLANGEQVSPAKMHWHHSPIKALSHCGPMLLSGASEGVLCKWNTDEMTPTFIPRLGGAVLHIFSSGFGRCCLSLLNNSILIIDHLESENEKIRWINGIDVPLEMHEARLKNAKLPVQEAHVLHTLQDGFCAITCRGRRVHFFDSRQGSLVFTAKMALGRSNMEEDVNRARWSMYNIAFSADASFIMTFEARVSPALKKFDDAASRSGVLKWWRRTEQNDYELDTVSNNVHGADISVALALPLREGLFVTGSLDGCFKCWEYLALNREYQTCWQCISSGGWRGQPIQSGCCSTDGSTLALGYAGAIVLWEPDTAVELNVLALDDSAHEAVHLFCVVACGRFMLVAHVKGKAGLDEVVCWDLASFDVVSRVDLKGALPGAGLMLLRSSAPQHAIGDLRLLAYRPPERSAKSGGHLCMWTLSKDAASFSLEATASLPHGRFLLDISFLGHGSRLLCWTSSLELWDFDLTAPSREAQETASHMEEEEALVGRGKIAKVLGQRSTDARATTVATTASLLDLPLRTTAAQQVGLAPHLLERVLPANAPSHMLPPPSSIWAGVLSVWGKRWHDSQGASAESQHDTLAESVDVEDEARALIFEDQDVPSWAQTGSNLPPADSCRSEFVDFQFMQLLLKDAAKSRRAES